MNIKRYMNKVICFMFIALFVVIATISVKINNVEISVRNLAEYNQAVTEMSNTTGEVEIKTVAEYDELLKAQYAIHGEDVTQYEELVLKRDFVNKVTYNTLTTNMQSNENFRRAVEWLMSDIDNLRLYIYGGAPAGSYTNSLNILGDLLNRYGADLQASGVTNGVQYKDIFRKMMITLSLTHSTNVKFWLYGTGSGSNTNTSVATTRYEVLKRMFLANKLNNKIFAQLEIEEMRFIMGSPISDDEFEWLQNYTKNVKKTTNVFYLMNYKKVDTAIYRSQGYYGESNYATYAKKYSLNGWNVANVAYYPKIWVVLDAGGVCWQISNVGQNIHSSYGIPSVLFGQPRHMAFATYSLENGQGVWTMNNDMFGWAQSQNNAYEGTRGYYRQRMINGWGNASWSNGSRNGSYLLLGQAAINDYDNYVKCEEIINMANMYRSEPAKREEILRKALEVQPFNLDAWAYLVEVYVNTSRTEQQYLDLAQELGEALKYYPVPALDLIDFIGNRKASSTAGKAAIANTKNYVLTSAQTVPNGEVLQANIVRLIANYLLGTVDTRIATFTIANGRLALTSRYEGSQVTWDYSLDGGTTWKEITESSTILSEEELDYMADTWGMYGIKVHIVGSDYSDANIYNIDIACGIMNINLFDGNDRENRLLSASGNAFYNLAEWRIKGEETGWTMLKNKQPDLTGNKTLELRAARYDNENASVTSSMIYEIEFTEDDDTLTRKYIPIRRLSAVGCSSGANVARVVNGFSKDYWQSNSEASSFVTIKLDEEEFISAIEYWPIINSTNGNLINGKVYVSMDGTNWTLATTVTNLANDSTPKMIEFEDSIEGQYVKLEWTRSGKGVAAASKINVFMDTTKSKSNQPATDIRLNKENLNIQVGESETLVATLTPVDTLDTVYWMSDNHNVVTVSDSGVVTAVGVGTAEITASIDGLTATCQVVVNCSHEGTLNHIEAKAATCLENGNNECYECSKCKRYFIDASASTLTTYEDQKIEALGHDFSVVEGDESYHWHKCSRCTTTDLRVAHIPGTPVIENEVEATHKERGSYDEVVLCTVCRQECSREEKTTPIKPHDNVDDYEWKNDETNHWKECSCGDVIGEEAHVFETIETNIVLPTTTSDGSKTIVVKCATCEYEKSRTIEKIDKLPSTEKNVKSISLNTSSLKIKKGQTSVLRVTIDPQDTTDDVTITWSSSNSSVATVNSTTGAVRGVDEGSTVITCTVVCKGKNNTITYTKDAIVEVEKSTDKQKLGDLDGDGSVNADDAAVALDFYKYGNATAEDLLVGDIDGDGHINADDAAAILDIYKYGI